MINPSQSLLYFSHLIVFSHRKSRLTFSSVFHIHQNLTWPNLEVSMRSSYSNHGSVRWYKSYPYTTSFTPTTFSLQWIPYLIEVLLIYRSDILHKSYIITMHVSISFCDTNAIGPDISLFAIFSFIFVCHSLIYIVYICRNISKVNEKMKKTELDLKS